MHNKEKLHSLLMVASVSGFIECARVLLNHNADINYCSNYDGQSVLCSACMSGNADMFKFIIERGVIINDNVLAKVFSTSGIVLNTEIATILVGHIQDVNGERGYGGFLISACFTGNVIAARLLLERGASLDYSNPLRAATEKGHLEVVKLLLVWYKNTAQIPQDKLIRALRWSSFRGFLDIIRSIVEYGTDVDSLNSALSEIGGSICSTRQHVEVAAFLIDSGADLNLVRPGRDCSFWVSVCMHSSPEMVCLFLDRGADPNALDFRGNMPLKAALSRPEILRVLLDHGADPNRRFLNGSTALQDLVHYKQDSYMQAMAVLLELGADPNLALEATGRTALMRAALELRADLVKLLLEYGADVTQVDMQGKGVLDMLGRTRKYGEVVELCTQYIDSNKPGARLLLK